MKMGKKGFLAACVMMLGFSFFLPGKVKAASTVGNGSLIFSPNPEDTYDDSGVTYVKSIVLKHNGNMNGTMLCVFDQQITVDGQGVWPVYKSTDQGASWTHVTDIRDDVYGTIHKMNPCIYELPQDVGNLKEGTILVAGLLIPDDWSQSQMTIYKSSDLGSSFQVLGVVDTGGPIEYDATPKATTSAVWEPYLYVDGKGRLSCYYSDERQKGNGVLQAVCYKSSWDGVNWGALTNVTAITNRSDRPGMITVSRMGNGKYIAVYEVVNRPSQKVNSAICYYKISEDGVTWDANDLGTPILLEDGTGCGSSPVVKWVDAGGPNGMVVVACKWQVDTKGRISGGQNLFVNYNYGEGTWERLPNALTFDGPNLEGLLSGYSGSLDTNLDNTVLYQAANVENLTTHRNEARIGAIPLNAACYEAENASLTNAEVASFIDASNGKKVGNINYSDSKVSFDKITVSNAGTYTVNVRYTNGTGSRSSHYVQVNGGNRFELQYDPSVKWGRYLWASFTCNLNAGVNTIAFTKGTGYAELDCIQVYKAGTDLSGQFALQNRNSGKYLEVANASTEQGMATSQYDWTNYPCQLWNMTKKDGSYIQLRNVNSLRMLEIQNASKEDGAAAVQYSRSGNYCQDWSLLSSDSGYYFLQNRNSGKYLEVANNLTTNGAAVAQWGKTGYSCQEWKLKKEGMK